MRVQCHTARVPQVKLLFIEYRVPQVLTAGTEIDSHGGGTS